MNPFTYIKRIFQAGGCLVVAVVMAGSALTSYVDKNPAVQERIELSAKDAETRVDEDAPFMEKVGALISSWWESDELIADAQQEKTLEAESKKKQKQREREHRFNDSQYHENDDYYASSN
jgi:hypothetical protein